MKDEIAAFGHKLDIWDGPINQVGSPGINIDKLSQFISINMK